jgi:hypothetical protein
MPRAATQHIPLNLKLPAARIQVGKKFAHLHGITVSALVSEVFGALEQLDSDPLRLHPLLEQLAGIIPDPGQTRQELVMEELERKYGIGPRR